MQTKELRSRIKQKQQPCYVCGKYRQLSECHHVVPLWQIKRMIELGYEFHDVPGCWLCPTHHALYHKLNGKRQLTHNEYQELYISLDDNEISKMKALEKQVDDWWDCQFKIIREGSGK